MRCETYGFVAHGAERLQVVQRALSSSSVDGPDVVDLPEISLDRSSDHLVQLERQDNRKARVSVPRSERSLELNYSGRKTRKHTLFPF